MQRGGSGRLSITLGCVYDDLRMGPATQRMLGVLVTYADTKTGVCRPEQRTLAARLGISRQAVSRALRELCEAGYIEIIERFSDFNGARLSSHYRVCMDYELPAEHRRTPQHDIAPLQAEIAPPATSLMGGMQADVATPLSLVEGGYQAELASIEEERLIENDPVERPKRTNRDVGADAPPVCAEGDAESRAKALPDPRIEEVWDYYRLKIQPAAREFAQDKIRTRLKRFTLDEVKLAIDHFEASPWQMEHNAHRGSAWWFHSDARVEGYLNMKPETQQAGRAKGAVPLGKGDPALDRKYG